MTLLISFLTWVHVPLHSFGWFILRNMIIIKPSMSYKLCGGIIGLLTTSSRSVMELIDLNECNWAAIWIWNCMFKLFMFFLRYRSEDNSVLDTRLTVSLAAMVTSTRVCVYKPKNYYVAFESALPLFRVSSYYYWPSHFQFPTIRLGFCFVLI